jgi:hypothetical protein
VLLGLLSAPLTSPATRPFETDMHKTVTPRFDLGRLGLADEQLKAIAGARPVSKTTTMTSPPVICPCCWS